MGGHIDSAFRELHAAEVIAASLLSRAQLRARGPDLLVKYSNCLADENDPRLRGLKELVNARGAGVRTASQESRPEKSTAKDSTEARASLRRRLVRLVDGKTSLANDVQVYSAALRSTYDILDQKHSALRLFRNALLLATLLLSVFVFTLCIITAQTPSLLPLCFTPESTWVCATSAGSGLPPRPSGGDIALIAFFGLLGAAVSSALAVSQLPRSKESHTISYALALFKLPLGSLTAIAGVLLVHGRFVPGLSELDTQPQILAYAFVFGFAQYVVTRLVDRQAKDLLGAIPQKESKSKPTESA
jgi:hypothetical protein